MGITIKHAFPENIFIEIITFSANMSPEMKSRITTVVNVAKTAFHWGYVPVVLYLGFKKGAEPGMPPLTLFSLLWQ